MVKIGCCDNLLGKKCEILWKFFNDCFISTVFTVCCKTTNFDTQVIYAVQRHYFIRQLGSLLQTISHGRQHRTWCSKLSSIRVHVLVLCTAANIRLSLTIFNNGTILSRLAHRCTSHLTSTLIPHHSCIRWVTRWGLPSNRWQIQNTVLILVSLQTMW